ncbi:type II toxin-antitoxin system Phd/YefM family antitoxin [Bradyrhizobium jicamae]|uniref:Antitoxin n=1 Tax=Bradyrhizobium jicamae TaxID=280332 RepID=A0ABS5FJ98_9BRAD|nr:type II toxin-antitoxin system Phd/YefM family antitoxin [Bradyrhizobium jicamae]MBR0796868.1 type II toxin-antitoxin system Phd/YefM family antitoxin [Bradyrhizobium jicamae]
MRRISARDAKNGFGLLMDAARAAPVAIEKYGRPVVVVIAVEEYEKLTARPLAKKQSLLQKAGARR